ncbi:hypothetical protein TIFTF001_001216 [Ficus carica]|uniref:Serpin domain-containing protein n=1 Tax=Ficus carica TaxID=3494 RepID=A0AA88CR30_FICCA|nr:hypothetical protein TIFTF001_001216 [Ficus carica]
MMVSSNHHKISALHDGLDSGIKATRGVIRNVVSYSKKKKDLVFILSIALYFKGAWVDPFDELCTRRDDFYTGIKREIVQVPYMSKAYYKSLSYASSKGFKILDIMEPLGLKLNLKNSEILEGLDGDIAMEKTKIIHKCCIEVNESGTEAAAVTINEEDEACSADQSQPRIDFIADHPFIFLVREETSDTNVFLGAVVNPLFE